MSGTSGTSLTWQKQGSVIRLVASHRKERTMLKHVILALAVICGISAATLAVSGLTAGSAAACDQNTPDPKTT